MSTSHDQPASIRPLVATGQSGQRGVWIFAAAATLSAAWLFSSLEARRETRSDNAITAVPEDNGATISTPPELAIPAPVEEVPTTPFGQTVLAQRATDVGGAGPRAEGRLPFLPPPRQRSFVPTAEERLAGARSYPAPGTAAPLLPATASAPAAPPSATPELVYDAARARPQPSNASKAEADTGKGPERVSATRFTNPGTTVPKGTVIQAVLESALDSTRAGLARAIISRDVFAFDGSHVLIPRGSRLIGEYKADLAAGQARALIQWQRLMRPDGVIINLDSPSADPLGRAGVKGKVDTHFFARFGGAMLQSALDIGVQVAASKLADGTTVYALPGLYALSGLGQGAGGRIGSEKVQPTLTVKQGTSVSVFVAKDLDFSTVDQ